MIGLRPGNQLAFATLSVVRVKSTAIASSQLRNFDLNTCVSVPYCTRLIRAHTGRWIILNSSCDNLIAAARTSRVDFLPNHTNRSRWQSSMYGVCRRFCCLESCASVSFVESRLVAVLNILSQAESDIIAVTPALSRPAHVHLRSISGSYKSDIEKQEPWLQ